MAAATSAVRTLASSLADSAVNKAQEQQQPKTPADAPGSEERPLPQPQAKERELPLPQGLVIEDELPLPPKQTASTAKRASQAALAKSKEDKSATLTTFTLQDAREAKRIQGLKGTIFQDRTSKVWYLEDSDDDTWKLKDGKFIKIARAKEEE